MYVLFKQQMTQQLTYAVIRVTSPIWRDTIRRNDEEQQRQSLAESGEYFRNR